MFKYSLLSTLALPFIGLLSIQLKVVDFPFLVSPSRTMAFLKALRILLSPLYRTVARLEFSGFIGFGFENIFILQVFFINSKNIALLTRCSYNT
jgi:hypothetical protein